MATKREGIPCYDKADLDEPLFVLRAQDRLAPKVIECWVRLAAEAGVNPYKLQDARDLARKMEEWPNRRNPT